MQGLRRRCAPLLDGDRHGHRRDLQTTRALTVDRQLVSLTGVAPPADGFADPHALALGAHDVRAGNLGLGKLGNLRPPVGAEDLDVELDPLADPGLLGIARGAEDDLLGGGSPRRSDERQHRNRGYQQPGTSCPGWRIVEACVVPDSDPDPDPGWAVVGNGNGIGPETERRGLREDLHFSYPSDSACRIAA